MQVYQQTRLIYLYRLHEKILEEWIWLVMYLQKHLKILKNEKNITFKINVILIIV